MLVPLLITGLAIGGLALTRKKRECTLDAAGHAYVDALLKADLPELVQRSQAANPGVPVTAAMVAAEIRVIADRAQEHGCDEEAKQLRAKADMVAGAT